MNQQLPYSSRFHSPITATLSSLAVTFMLVCGIGFVASAQSPSPSTYNYTGSAQTFTVPAGIHSVNVDAWGGGGAGGGTGPNNSRGGGGAGGNHIRTTSVAVTPAAGITVTVGRGGQPGAAGAD